MSMPVYSFDVFDTCLVRSYLKSEDLFVDLARAADRHFQLHLTEQEQQRFVQTRKLAEQNARKTAKAEDVTLEQIYKKLSAVLPWDLNFQWLMRKELELEAASLFPVALIRKTIQHLRKQGKTIVFISDMYLPETFVAEQLIKARIAARTDKLYVSSAVGLRKKTGNLFLHVLNDQGIQPGQLVHCGDNIRSDILAAKTLGIQTRYFNRAKTNAIEKYCLKRLSNFEQKRLLAFSRILRLSRQELPEVTELTANVIAPLLTAYVAWVLLEARKNRIARLYFVSRDGQILLHIAKQMTALNQGIELKYLYGSRQTWRLASVMRCDAEDLYWLMPKKGRVTVAGVLSQLNISCEDVRDSLTVSGFPEANAFHTQLSSVQMSNLWQCILSEPLSELVIENAKQARSLATEYFKQQGLLEPVSWALVDSGWQLTSQLSLSKILGNSHPVAGFYLGVRADRVQQNVGKWQAFFEQGKAVDSTTCDRQWVFEQGAPFLLEDVFMMNNQPPLKSYQRCQEKIKPLFDTEHHNFQHHDTLSVMRGLTAEYTRYVNKLITLGMEPETVISTGSIPASRFFGRPSKKIVSAIAHIRIDVDSSHDPKLARTLASPFTFTDVLKILCYLLDSRRSNYQDPAHAWYRGSAVLSGFILKWLLILALNVKRSMHLRQQRGS